MKVPTDKLDRPINPEMVTLARESRGLTQSRLARIARVSQGHLSKIEAGLIPVSESTLTSIAGALDYPLDFFHITETVFGPSATEFYHRKRQAVSTTVLRRLHAQINIRRIHVAKLLAAVETGENNIPKIDPEEFGGSATEVARAIRAAWQLPAGPVKNLTKTIEDAGGIVVRCDFGTPQLDAISRWVPGLPPLFFVNRDAPGDRQRLTLAHELGHIVMHQIPNPQMENEAFEFGAELLMPAYDIRPYFGEVTIPKLAALKPMWKVSMAALNRRARDIAAISERQYRFLLMRMGKLGYRTSEPPELDVPQEQPELLNEILRLYRTEFGYTLSDLATHLAVHQHELVASYELHVSPDEQRHRLRVVG